MRKLVCLNIGEWLPHLTIIQTYLKLIKLNIKHTKTLKVILKESKFYTKTWGNISTRPKFNRNCTDYQQLLLQTYCRQTEWAQCFLGWFIISSAWQGIYGGMKVCMEFTLSSVWKPSRECSLFEKGIHYIAKIREKQWNHPFWDERHN